MYRLVISSVRKKKGKILDRNVFQAISKFGHDEDFAPLETDEFGSTEAPAGSRQKLDVLAERVAQGLPLWHEQDRTDYSGLTGVIRPRD